MPDCYTAYVYDRIGVTEEPTKLEDTQVYSYAGVPDADLKAFEICLAYMPFIAGGSSEDRRMAIELAANLLVADAQIGTIGAAHVNDSEPVGTTWDRVMDGSYYIHPLVRVGSDRIAMYVEASRSTLWYQCRIHVVQTPCEALLRRLDAMKAIAKSLSSEPPARETSTRSGRRPKTDARKR